MCETFTSIIILLVILYFVRNKYIRIDKIPTISSISKNTSIMYMQKELDRLEKELEEKEGSITFCLECDIDRLKETINFLKQF